MIVELYSVIIKGPFQLWILYDSKNFQLPQKEQHYL